MTRTHRPSLHLSENIPAGGTSQAGCAPVARRGEEKGLREALSLKSASRQGRAA